MLTAVLAYKHETLWRADLLKISLVFCLYLDLYLNELFQDLGSHQKRQKVAFIVLPQYMIRNFLTFAI